MSGIFDYPLLVLLLALAVQWLAILAGGRLRKARTPPGGLNFGTVLGAELTLLALVVGFTFAMAVSRYDQRKNLEEEEANAIGTEYVRADFLPPAERAQVKGLLVHYLGQRILTYETREGPRLERLRADTGRTQRDLWTPVAAAVGAHPDAPRSLVASGMNDVLNSQGYAQAAAWNRIPPGAWLLVLIIAGACNLLLGYSREEAGGRVVLALPLIISMSVFLIADIDSPHGGVIRVVPKNLIALSGSMTSR